MRTVFRAMILCLVAGISLYAPSLYAVQGPAGKGVPLGSLTDSLAADRICVEFGDAGCRAACQTVGASWGACDESNTCWCFGISTLPDTE